MPHSDPSSRSRPSQRFFLRGLTILLPSVLTIWILIAGYQFMQQRIAEPINRSIRVSMVQWSPWPTASETEMRTALKGLSLQDHAKWQTAMDKAAWTKQYVKTQKVQRLWSDYQFPLDLLGLIVAIILIYIVGMLLGSYIGHRLYRRGEQLLQRLPLIKQVYPSVKQITDFLVAGNNDKHQFSRVVAVQYPRERVWAVGFVTGDTFNAIDQSINEPCVTVFIPSSPTPFTGYTTIIPKRDTIDLPITVEEAMRFTVSGGVVAPPSQRTVAMPVPQMADEDSKSTKN